MKIVTKKPQFTLTKLSLAISSLFVMSINVYAQDDAKVEESKKHSAMEVIEVTARKKIESIQNVPMSVNALTGDHIENMGISDIEDLSKFIPGLEQPRLALQNRLSLRGVSSGDNTSFEQSVGTYVDGIYRGRMNQQRAGFFDMERVEVLKGPQVTLYGNSSVGGAISMITRRPELDSEITGNITAKYGIEYEQTEFLGGVNIPVTDEFAVRIAGKFRDQSKGAAFNNYEESLSFEPRAKDDAFRVGAYWEPTSDLSLYLRYEQGNFESIGHNLDPQMHLNQDFTDKTDSPLIGFGMGDDELNVGSGAPFTNGRDGSLVETEETMLEVVYNLNDNITFTSITGMSSFDFSQNYDVDITPVALIDTSQDETYEQFSQELRVAIIVSDSLDILVGGYYQDDDFRNDYGRYFNAPVALGAIGLPPVIADNFGPMSVQNYLDQNTKQSSLFTQVDYAFTDKLSATVGVRYTETEKKADQGSIVADVNGTPDFGEPLPAWFAGIPSLAPLANVPNYLAFELAILGGTPQVNEGLIRKEDHTMYQASIRYQLSDDTMFYATWANGAKAGGFDLLFEGKDKDNLEYEDEQANAFEIGFKQDWENVRLNVGAFYGQYDDLQVSIFNGSVGFNVGNAATSIQQGVDAELSWVVTDNLFITANVEYLDFTYDSFDGAACSFSEDPAGVKGSCDWSGRELPWVPKIKSVINAEHLWEISSSLELTNMVSVSYKSDHTTSSDNEELNRQDGYALVDYRATLTSLENDWHLALTVSNLLDQDYEVYTTKIPLNNGAFAHSLFEGREITLEVGYAF